MQEVVHISSTVSATIFSPIPLHAPAPVEADALDINGTPFTVDAPSSGGSNNFHSFHEQSDTQLLPTSHEPPTKKPKISKRRYLRNPNNPKHWLFFCKIFLKCCLNLQFLSMCHFNRCVIICLRKFV
jgi:hypothetical protein